MPPLAIAAGDCWNIILMAKVLVVEDEEPIADLIRDLFEGHEVTVAADGVNRAFGPASEPANPLKMSVLSVPSVNAETPSPAVAVAAPAFLTHPSTYPPAAPVVSM